jgi:hypothetical protein
MNEYYWFHRAPPSLLAADYSVAPPSRWSVWPVMKSDALEAR